MTARITQAFLLLLVVWLMVACNTVVHGNVTGKAIHPAGMILMPIPISMGKSTIITFIPIIYPESYSIIVRGPDKNGHLVEDEIYVTKNQFDLIHDGDAYTCGEKVECQTERPSGRR